MEKGVSAPGAIPGGHGLATVKDVEELLVALRRTSKDLTFYPTGHPLLNRSLERAAKQLRDVVGGRSSLTVGVTPSGFSFEGRPVGAENRQLAGMAPDLFLRRIQQIIFGRGIEVEELVAFLRMTAADAKSVLEQGGPAKLLASQGVGRIQVSELDLRLLEQRPGLGGDSGGKAGTGAEGEEAGPETAPSEAIEAPDVSAAIESGSTSAVQAPPEEDTWETLLQRLEQEAATGGVAGYEWAASRLESAAGDAVRGGRLAEVLPILRAVLTHREADPLAAPIRQRAAKAVDAIATRDAVAYLIGQVCGERGDASLDPAGVLVALGPRVLAEVLSRLAAVERGPGRDGLLRLLLRFREAALRPLADALRDADRELAYDVATGLGETHDAASVSLLGRLAKHRAVWVRAEALRSLGKIGGEAASRLLIQALRDSDPGVIELVINILGTGRVKQATPSLLRFATRRDLKGRPFALRKAAVAALGDVGDPGCIPTLTSMLYARTWFRRAAGDALRRTAAAALLRTGRLEGREAVEAGARSRRRDVRRACDTVLREGTVVPSARA
jgi:hypothetical protein